MFAWGARFGVTFSLTALGHLSARSLIPGMQSVSGATFTCSINAVADVWGGKTCAVAAHMRMMLDTECTRRGHDEQNQMLLRYVGSSCGLMMHPTCLGRFTQVTAFLCFKDTHYLQYFTCSLVLLLLIFDIL